MQLNKSTWYAAEIVLYLTKNRRVVAARELSLQLMIADRNLRLIIAKLRKQGFVGAIYGPLGGYYLLKEPANISMYDIAQIQSPNVQPVEGIQSAELLNAYETFQQNSVTCMKSISFELLTQNNG